MGRMSELAEFLKASDDCVLLGHVNPDGDSAGSCIALALALQTLGKRVCVHLPGGLPQMYRDFYTQVQLCTIEQLPFVPQLAFAVDVSEAERLGDGKQLFDSCARKAVLDHHATNSGYGQVCLIDGAAASCGELAVELIGELGVRLVPQMAQWLFIAICTDSGRFGYSSTRPETLEAAAQCLRAGIDVDQITRKLYCTRSEGRTRLLGRVLTGLELDPEKQMCWARLTEEMFKETGALREDSEGIVNYLLEIQGVSFACLAEQRGDQTKFSLRGKPPFNVAAGVAVPLGGGGHTGAAGVTLNMPMEEALQKVLTQAGMALRELKEMGKNG